MDGFPNKKTQKWRGNFYSETRYYVIKWLERELPKITGSIIEIGAGNWSVPKQLVDTKKITEYKRFDQKMYGDSKNIVDFYGDVHNMDSSWDNKWDNVFCFEALECMKNPFVAINEMYRILKPHGQLLMSVPFNYRFFGNNTGLPKKKNRVYDYWRITRDGHEMLLKDFSNVNIIGFGGSGEHDRFGYCIKATK